MHNLLAFLVRYYHWLLFLFLEIVSGVMLFQANSYQGSVWISSANAVSGKVFTWQSSVEQFFQLQKRAQDLTEHNVMLEQELASLRNELRELKKDTTVTDSVYQVVFDNVAMLPAKVVGNSLNRPDNLITIDKGRSDGVQPDMGVICGTGLVGVVYIVRDHYSVVLPVLNTHSRVSCAIRDSGYFGYLQWDAKDPMTAYIEDVPRHAQFNVGSWIETSGYSSIFPPGITVGQITSIGNSADGLSYRLKIKLSTDFGCLRDVFVITDKDFVERFRLMSEARDSIAQTN